MREIDSWSGRSWAIIGTTRGAERAQVGVEMVGACGLYGGGEGQ